MEHRKIARAKGLKQEHAWHIQVTAGLASEWKRAIGEVSEKGTISSSSPFSTHVLVTLCFFPGYSNSSLLILGLWLKYHFPLIILLPQHLIAFITSSKSIYFFIVLPHCPNWHRRAVQVKTMSIWSVVLLGFKVVHVPASSGLFSWVREWRRTSVGKWALLNCLILFIRNTFLFSWEERKRRRRRKVAISKYVPTSRIYHQIIQLYSWHSPVWHFSIPMTLKHIPNEFKGSVFSLATRIKFLPNIFSQCFLVFFSHILHNINLIRHKNISSLSLNKKKKWS